MADYYVSLTMALPEDKVPETLVSLEDLSSIHEVSEGLVTSSRKNWLIYAVELGASHYGFPRLSYLSEFASSLDPSAANLAAQDLSDLLKAIELNPASLARLLGQNGWSDQEIQAMLQVDASPWGPLVESDDGDDLPYLLSFLLSQFALLRHAVAQNLHVAFAQTSPYPLDR